MTAPDKTPPRRLRRTLLAAAAVLMLVGAPAVSAFAEGVVTDPGGDYNDPSTSNGTGVRSSSKCTNGYGTVGGGMKMYDKPFVKCPDFFQAVNRPQLGKSKADAWTFGPLQQCQTGFEVWRFYGYDKSGVTGTTTPTAWSASQVNLPQWCDNNGKGYTMFSPHPDDTGKEIASPFKKPAVYTNPSGDPYKLTASGSSATVLKPTARSGSCATLQTTDPLKQWFNPNGYGINPSLTGAQKTAALKLQASLLGVYKDWVKQSGDSFTALTTINAKAVKGSQIWYGDGISCSSGLDYATTKAGAVPVSYGTCFIRTYSTVRKASNSSNGYTTMQRLLEGPNGGQIRGERYVRDYASNLGDPAPKWRAVIKSERMARGHNSTGASTQTSGGWTSWTTAEAASDASKYARCVSGQGLGYEVGTPAKNPVPADGVTINANTPPVFQVGGTLRPQSWTATVSPLMCGAKACDASYKLTDLDWTLRLSTASGAEYKQCATMTASGCDYFVAFDRIDPGTRSQKATVYFFSATMPGQKVKVAVTGTASASAKPSGTYTQSFDTTSTLRYTPPAGMFDGKGTGSGNATTIAIPLTTTDIRTVKFTPKVIGTGAPIVIGANAR